MAVSPGIRDPQLNSAECVTEGHKQDILATGQSFRMIIILCCSFLFSVLSGPLLASYVMLMPSKEKKNTPKKENETHQKKEKETHQKKKKKHTKKKEKETHQNKEKETHQKCQKTKRTIHVLCGSLLVIFFSLSLYCIICSFVIEEKPKDLFLIFMDLLIAGVGFVVGGCICHICRDSFKCYAGLYVACANLTVYHFCWLLIGIMLNPTWGLAVLLTVCLVIGVFTYLVFTFLSSDNHRCQSFFSCLAAFLAICCLIVVVIIAGQSYHGRQTADEVLKDGVLYLISISFSWLYWKHCASKNSSLKSQHQLETPV